jgi:hypothetical protein
MPKKQTTRILLFVALSVCTLQIWWPAYFVTGDGPCHVYNAQILHDTWVGKNVSFYSRFYDVVYQPNPNWFSTAFMAALMFIVNGILAEKILLTIYVLLFVGGLYSLLKKINAGGALWVFSVFVIVFPHVLSKGFYNFSFGMAFYFWIIWSWLRFLESKNTGKTVAFFLFCCLLFFSHPFAFVLAIVTCAALTLSVAVAGSHVGSRSTFFFKHITYFILLAAPFVVSMIWFTQKEGGMQLHFRLHLYRVVELAQGKHLVNLNHNELPYTTIAGSVILIMFLLVLFRYKVLGWIHKYDGLLWTFVFIFIVYLLFPEEILGRYVDMSVRTQLFVFILLLCCISYRLDMPKLKNAAALILFASFLVLSGLRFSCQLSAAHAQVNCMSAATFIKPNSVVLPLNFVPAGVNEKGGSIADWNNSFIHSVQYIGTVKPLIILDNYEANTSYFPVRWKAEVNPYFSLDSSGSTEAVPPYARINEYKAKTGVVIDYILMWYDDVYFAAENKNLYFLYARMVSGYHKVYQSPLGHVTLFEKDK